MVSSRLNSVTRSHEGKNLDTVINNLTTQEIKDKVDKINNHIWENLGNDIKVELSKSKEAIELAEKINHQEGIAFGHLNYGKCSFFYSKMDDALMSFQKALDLYKTINSKEGILRSYNALGVLYHNARFYDKALDYYSKIVSIAEKINNVERLSASLSNIGEIHKSLGDNQEALTYFQKALDITEKEKHVPHTGLILINIANAYLELNQPEIALKKLFIALDLIKKNNKILEESLCLTEIGKVYQSLDNFEKAEEYHFKSLEISTNCNQKYRMITIYLNIGEFYFLTKDYNKSTEYLQKALEQSKSSNAKMEFVKIYSALYTTEKAMSNFEKALEYHEKIYKLEKENFSTELKKRISLISADFKYKNNMQENEIYKLRNIELKKKSEELEKSYENLSIISSIGQKLTATLNIEELLDVLYKSINSLMDATVFGIAIYDENTKIIDYKMFLDNSKRLYPHKLSIDTKHCRAAECIKENRILLINNFKEDEKYIELNESLESNKMSRSLIYIPLRLKEKIIGVLTVQSYEPNRYTEKHVKILTAMASYIVSAIQNSIKHDEVTTLNKLLEIEKKELEKVNLKIKFLANHDPLTRLPNRRLLMKFLNREIKKCKEENQILSILYVDLDDFKLINDNYGHKTGDYILKNVARKIKRSIKKSDFVSRVGGDEFIIVLPGIKDKNESRIIAEKIIDNLNQEIEIHKHRFTIKASIGISIYPDNSATIKNLLAKADQAMYTIKNKNKNSYYFYK